jgi:hypothetical protein
MKRNRSQWYAKPGTPPPTPSEIDESVLIVRAKLAEMHQAQYDSRIAAAEAELARRKASALRAHIADLERQVARGGKP